jgi:hypothetical protein
VRVGIDFYIGRLTRIAKGLQHFGPDGVARVGGIESGIRAVSKAYADLGVLCPRPFDLGLLSPPLEPELVRGSAARTGGDRGLAGGLQHGATTQFVGIPNAGRICGGQGLWKRRGLRPLGKRFAFPTFPQPRRRTYLDFCSGTENLGSFVMTGPKTGSRSSEPHES